MINLPCSFNCHIFCRHSTWNFFVPTHECIPCLHWIIWCSNFCSIILCYRFNWTSTINIKSDCILINLPCSSNCHVFCRHSTWNFFVPTHECIPCLHWIIWCSNFCSIILCYRFNFTSTIGIKSNCILNNLPCSSNCHVTFWHSTWNFFVPTLKCIPCFCWVFWYSNLSAIILCYRRNFASTVSIKSNCILINLPCSCNCHVTCRHSTWNFFVPTLKCISFFSWIFRRSNVCSIILRYRINCTSTISIKGNCILINLPFSSNY